MSLRPLVNDDKKFVVFWNAKAGCSAVKRWYLNSMGIDTKDVNVHKFLNTPQFAMNKNNYLVEYKIKKENYYTFIVCRNPWKRIVSYYKNKKVMMGHKNKTWPIDTRIRDFNSENLSFRELVYHVYKTPDHFLEEHLQSQMYGLGDVKFDKVVRLENFNKDMTEVCDFLKIENRDFRNTNKSPITEFDKLVCDLKPNEFKNNLPPYQMFYDDKLKKIVEKKFKRDIEFFNYRFED